MPQGEFPVGQRAVLDRGATTLHTLRVAMTRIAAVGAALVMKALTVLYDLSDAVSRCAFDSSAALILRSSTLGHKFRKSQVPAIVHFLRHPP